MPREVLEIFLEGYGRGVEVEAGLLRIGQNLEKSGKTDAALGSYRRIVKEYPDTPTAKTAAERIKALAK